MSDTQTPIQEAAERIAEASPARGIPFLIGLENYRSMMSDWRQRNRDDHKLNMKMLGAEVEESEPEDMGDIMVSGDSTKTENHYHYSAPESQSAAAGKEAPSVAGKLLPLALAAALGAGGLWAFDTWNNFEWPGVPDTAYEVRFYNADGELIEVPRYAPTEGTP